ncbi:MAG: PEP/pyruvate-binding domain-containing protein [Phycisphaerae bacterium]|nr:PEP/pyruvate-binding domain-containing protein [Phycisphaerae bacterium]
MMGAQLTTGLKGLDGVLKALLPGDNIVWQVDSVADYAPFVRPCGEAARKNGSKVIYFRFAEHPPLLPEDSGAEIVPLDPGEGFERVIRQIHSVINHTRDQGVYIFDCLSDLAADWYSDRMLGNFFLLICPYVYDVGGLACFAMLRNHHSFHACSTIMSTTQIMIDTFRYKGFLYLHPLKVQHRHSPTMYMLHAWKGDEMSPVIDSPTIAEILTSVPQVGWLAARTRPDVWDRTFLRAEHLLEHIKQGDSDRDELQDLLNRLLPMLISRDERVLELARKHFRIEDLIRIWKRTIGTGLIGGKSVGMLLARAILRHSDPRWETLLEKHDSFFIGSDVFYTYLVQNGCWWLREKQRDPKTLLEGAEEVRRRILTGSFSAVIRRDFADMLDYFGQSPIIVRSSSLLEDAFGNSFAGQYESLFCVNQGSREERLEDFIAAVKTIYASAMGERALQYRLRRGMLDDDEQMSLLVQRVSGTFYQNLYYPQAAGVGLSFNPYAWDEQIDPKAGVLRLVFGLGTRAVDRTDDDYTRVVALNVPSKRPEADIEQIRRYTQHKVDVLDRQGSQLVSREFLDVIKDCPGLPLDVFASRDPEAERLAVETGRRDLVPYMLTFERLLETSSFPADMRQMLEVLEAAYACPVDTEFTVNFLDEEDYRINLVQCRPLHVANPGRVTALPQVIAEKDIVFTARGAVVGQSRAEVIDRLIYVVPSAYGGLPVSERYAVARLIGRLMRHPTTQSKPKVMLLGPGRWGTKMPSLGIPVSYAEISGVSVLCEIVAMHEGLVPDVSLGTHFFNELIEAEILYLALFPGREGNSINEAFLKGLPNRLEELTPNAAQRVDLVRVIDAADLTDHQAIHLNANNVKQEVVCYLARP